MGFVAAFDKSIFYNQENRYCIFQLKTADKMVPPEARSSFKQRDHLIRFVAVGYDLPRDDTVKMELEGTWTNDGKHGLRFEVEHWKEILPSTVQGIRAYLASRSLKCIGEKTADAIVERFGDRSLEVLEHEPERLLEIRGITEERLEEIKTGYMESRVMRELLLLLAPLKVTPNTALKILGHFGMKGVELLRESLFRLCEVPGFGFRRVDEIVRNSGGNIYLPHVYKQECETALKVAQMALHVPEPVNLTPVMEHVRNRLGITLSQRQAEGVEMVFRHNLSIITGGPGTGKSTILRAVVEAYRMLYPERRTALAAPTGKASRRMAETTGVEDAQTLHSLLKLHGDDSGQNKKQPLEAGLLIVDETSMVDMWLAHQLFTRLPSDTKVLLVGDADQLESVGAGNVFQELIESGIVPVTVLDQIFRQAEDSRIAYNARFINEGNGELYYGPDFSFIPATDQEEAAEIVCRLYKEEAARVGVQQLQILSPYRKNGEASSQNLNEMIREEINPEMEGKPEMAYGGRVFRLRDRVIQLKNNSKMVLYNRQGDIIGKGVFNGDAGFVREIRPDTVIINFDGRYAKYPLDSLEELELSYAMTIHRAQGSEYDTVIIPLLMAHWNLLTRNLLYTAVTRAKGRVLLVGQKKALFTAISKTRKGKRNTLLAERMRLYHRKLTSQSLTAADTPMRKAS